MPVNNNQPTLLQCAICSKRLACPWKDFSNNIKKKYCPVLGSEPEVAYNNGASQDERNSLIQFLNERLN